MAIRLYLARAQAGAVEPGGDAAPAIARRHAVAWRGWGWWNDDGTLATSPPPMPANVIAFQAGDDRHLLAVNATDFSWFDAHGRELAVANLDDALSAPQRNAANTYLAANGYTTRTVAGDTPRALVERLAAENPRLPATFPVQRFLDAVR